MSTKSQVYQIKITLKRSKPPIWRRVLLPGDSSLMRLHCVIQQSMGWDDAHLHMFEIDDMRYSAPMPFDRSYLSELDAHNTKTTRLSTLFPEAGKKFLYEYDFGDGWEHTILIEKILPPDPELTHPVCIKGKRACPPEDVGGIWGYAHFLEALADPDHESHEDYMEWMGGDFDPQAFDIDEANKRLTMLC